MELWVWDLSGMELWDMGFRISDLFQDIIERFQWFAPYFSKSLVSLSLPLLAT